jgi:hypothetical protein
VYHCSVNAPTYFCPMTSFSGGRSHFDLKISDALQSVWYIGRLLTLSNVNSCTLHKYLTSTWLILCGSACQETLITCENQIMITRFPEPVESSLRSHTLCGISIKILDPFISSSHVTYFTLSHVMCLWLPWVIPAFFYNEAVRSGTKFTCRVRSDGCL